MIIIIMLLIFIYYGITYLIKKNDNYIEYNKYQISNMNRLVSEKSKLLGFKVSFKKIFAYNPRKREIYICKKECYNETDLFCFWHEVGHYLDDSDGKVLKIKGAVAIGRIVFWPLFLFFSLLIEDGKEKNFLYMLLFVLLTLCECINIFFILKYEKSASNYAIRESIKLGFEKQKVILLKKNAKLAAITQLLWSTIMWIFTLFLFKIFIS